MSLREVQAENGSNVRVFADSDEEAFELAVAIDPRIEMAGVVSALGEDGKPLPVGWHGGDAEDAIAEGESIDNGDYK